MSQNELVLIPLWYAMFLLSVTCHEAAHAFAAHRGGDPTAYLGGQVTLNPAPHIRREPVGTVLVPLLGFWLMGWMMGWASAPYDPLWEDRHPRRAAAMAAAGPLANLLLAVLGFVVLKAGLESGWWTPAVGEFYEFDRLVRPVPGQAPWLDGFGRLASILLSLNLLLCLFNLIPLPPLDGAAVLAGLFAPARRLRDRLRASAGGGFIGLLVAWYSIGYVFGPLYRLVMGLLVGREPQ
jgi:Zn-dependent protease